VRMFNPCATGTGGTIANVLFLFCRREAPCGGELLRSFANCDGTSAFMAAEHSERALQLLSRFYVGDYLDVDNEVVETIDASTFSSPLMEAQRHLALFLGLYTYALTLGPPLQPIEGMYKKLLQSSFFQGGLESKVLCPTLSEWIEKLEESEEMNEIRRDKDFMESSTSKGKVSNFFFSFLVHDVRVSKQNSSTTN